MVQAHDASGAEMITVAVRRVNISDRSKESLGGGGAVSTSSTPPATSFCRTPPAATTADEAVRTARLGREAGLSNLGEARGDRRRTDTVSRQRSAPRSHARPRARRIRRAGRTRATIRSSAASSKTPGRRPSCRSARRSARVWCIQNVNNLSHHPRVRARAARGRRRVGTASDAALAMSSAPTTVLDEHGDRRRAGFRSRWPRP